MTKPIVDFAYFRKAVEIMVSFNTITIGVISFFIPYLLQISTQNTQQNYIFLVNDISLFTILPLLFSGFFLVLSYLYKAKEASTFYAGVASIISFGFGIFIISANVIQYVSYFMSIIFLAFGLPIAFIEYISLAHAYHDSCWKNDKNLFKEIHQQLKRTFEGRQV
ncbi:MAG: hypothetical protein KGI00_02060 [Candidatus Micrarchaeota archaeon]|nr:hypothetical protein [Candidatus Micrarchaeota archaeon]